MCKRPIFLPNPYYRTPNLLDSNLTDKELRKKYGHNAIYKRYSFLHDTTHQRIAVPCGECAECYALKQSYLAQRLQLGSLVYDYWMITLTYNKRNLPTIVIGDYVHAYADYSHVQKMFKRIREYNKLPDGFRYFVASEYGGKFHRPHFHIILALPKKKWMYNERDTYTRYLHKLFLDEWKVNKGKSDKYPQWDSLLDYKVNKITKKSTYDCRPVDDFVDSSGKLHLGAMEVGFYLTKYVTKFDEWLVRKKHMLRINYPEDYHKLWNLFRPKWRFSKGFLFSHYDNKHPDNATLWPQIVDKMKSFHHYNMLNPDNGFRYYIPEKQKVMPLSPYLRDKFYSVNEILDIFYNRTSDRYSDIDNSLVGLSPDEARKAIQCDAQKDMHLLKVRKILSSRNDSENFETIYNKSSHNNSNIFFNTNGYDIDIEELADVEYEINPFDNYDIDFYNEKKPKYIQLSIDF